MLLIKNTKVYDTLKYIAQILLPALGVLYYGLAQTWNFPEPDKVVASVVALDTFLGVLLHLSSTAYDKSEAKYDGTIDLVETDDKKTYSLNLSSDIDDLDKKDEILFKVNPIKNKTILKKKIAAKRRTTS